MTGRTHPVIPYDVIIAADMSVGGDRAFRIALEARHYARSGCRVGLLHTRADGKGRPVSQEIAACIRRGSAHPVDPAIRSASQLLVIHDARALRDRMLPKITAKKTMIVACEIEDFAAVGDNMPRGATWTPASDDIRAQAPADARLSRVNWLPPELSGGDGALVALQETSAIGWIASDGDAQSPPSAMPDSELFALLLDGEAVEPSTDPQVVSLDANDVSLERLIGRLSALAYFPANEGKPPPDALIMSALRAGMPVALPSRLKARYLDSAIYCEASDAPGRLASLLSDPEALRTHRAQAKRAASRQLGAKLPAIRGMAAPTPSANGPRPVIFMAGGSTGLGHVTRLLAIARKLDPQVPVLFICQGNSVGVVEQMGYAAEYMPSASYLGGSISAWNEWLRCQLDELFDTYDPALVVFDGNHLYPGLAKAAASRPDCRLGWVRRGLWGKSFSRYIANARWCDLIIEPGELTGQPDNGVTARRRAEVKAVAPIRLLDPAELLSRQDARKALGLDPDKPAVLLQLGANSTRETVSSLDWLAKELRQTPGLQMCLCEVGEPEFDFGCWPGIIHLRGYPISQYIRAFDFSIAAAGYNTFHEAIAFGVPTIFIPNSDPSLDDQPGRAEYAQNLAAAFMLDEEGRPDLSNIVKLLLEPKGRTYLADNCRRIALPNGAEAAAALLAPMLEDAA